MKNRASLVLMELLVILLVFALCAGLCLRIFVAAESISEENRLRDEAVILARNTAEAWKLGIPLPEVPEGLRREIRNLPREIPGLSRVDILIASQSGQRLICLTLGRQEVGS